MCIKNLKIPLNCFLFPFPQQEILFSRFVFHHTSTPTKKYHFLNEMRSVTTLGLSRKFVQEETLLMLLVPVGLFLYGVTHCGIHHK